MTMERGLQYLNSATIATSIGRASISAIRFRSIASVVPPCIEQRRASEPRAIAKCVTGSPPVKMGCRAQLAPSIAAIGDLACSFEATGSVTVICAPPLSRLHAVTVPP